MAVNKTHSLTVISPTPSPNPAPLTTRHTGQEEATLATDIDNVSDMNTQSQENNQTNEMAKGLSKKKSKKSKTTKEDTATKRDRSGPSLKKSSYASAAKVVGTTPSTKDYKFERVFYEAGLELKGKNKYSPPTLRTSETY